MTVGKKKDAWVSTYDSEANRWVTWDEMQQDWYRERQARQHHNSGNAPILWVMQSNRLHLAARSLWSEGETLDRFGARERQEVALMLAGMSLECAIKSRMICECGFPLSAQDQKRVFSGTHDLVALAKSAKIRTNVSDRKLLGGLSTYIRWLGRYPTPKTADEMVRYMLGRSPEIGVQWALYLQLRDKIGRSLTGPMRRWRAFPRGDGLEQA